MMNTQVPYPEQIYLLLMTVFIVARWCLMGQPAFRSELVIEDLILLLILMGFGAPQRFRRLIGLVINSLVCSTITFIVWTKGTRNFSLVLFALFAICSTAQALIELSKLRKHGTNGVHPQ
jgi:hypothetical protein